MLKGGEATALSPVMSSAPLKKGRGRGRQGLGCLFYFNLLKNAASARISICENGPTGNFTLSDKLHEGPVGAPRLRVAF